MKIFDKPYMKKTVGILAIVSAVIITGLLLFWFFGGKVRAVTDESGIRVTGIVRSYNVRYDEVTSVQLLSHFNVGKAKPLRSVETYSCDNGDFVSEVYGEYRLDIYKGVSRYIVLTTSEGTYVLNANNVEDTEALYKSLCNSVRDAGGAI